MNTHSPDTSIPDHVPLNLILPFNPWVGMQDRPHEVLEKVRPFGAVVYSPVHHLVGMAPRGSWMITRAKEARELLQRTDTFSSQHTTGIPQALGEPFILAPIEADPPEHTKTRSILNPLFSPKAMRTLEGKIRDRAAGLIDNFISRGECDFVADFAKVLPSEIFLDMFGLPYENLNELLHWEEMIMGATDFNVRLSGLKLVADYLRQAIQIRRDDPEEDVLSAVGNMQIDGHRVSESDALGSCMLLYIAGLDTVANALCWQFRHLAENASDQSRLRADPALIPRAVEEMLRGYSIVSMTRIVSRDCEFSGVQMKKGDVISIPSTLASRDPAEFPNPESIDLNRSSRRHYAFGAGPHICLGMHLARVEIVSSIDMWLSKVPQFRIATGAVVPCHGGAVLTVERLPLTWS
jgi:cytochrome P450